MAPGTGNEELFKKNSKFESFLKRTISEEAFERIRAYESCIVISEKENKAFKFVAISDEWVYLTENPPKNLQEVVHFKDVTSVDLVNEYPDFLSGHERSNTQHIAISFTTYEPRRRSTRRSRKSPRGSMSDVNADRSNASTPLGYSSSVDSGVEDTLSHSLSSLGQSRPASRGSSKALGGKKKKKNSGLNDSLDHDSILRSLKEEIEEDMLEDIEEDRLSMMKSSVTRMDGPTLNSHTTFGDSLGSRPSRKCPPPPPSDSGSVRSTSQQSLRPLPPMPRTGAFEGTAKPPDALSSRSSSKQPLVAKSEVKGVTGVNDVAGVKEVEKVDAKGCCSFLKCCGQKNQVTPICKSTETAVITTKTEKLDPPNGSSLLGSHIEINLPPSRGSSVRGGSRTGTPLLETERNINEVNSSTSDLTGRTSSFFGLTTLGVDGVSEKRKCVLNIFLLNVTSPFMMLLKSAWYNYTIKSTMSLEPGEIEISTVPMPMSATNRTKVERQYAHLKRDLFQVHASVEEQQALVHQLRSMTSDNFLWKKLFWKNPDVFSFLIAQLHKYLPQSAAILTTDEGKAQRADEIEFVTEILTAINSMFRESEILPSRLQTLQTDSGKALNDLLTIVQCHPDLPYQPITLTKHWSAPLAGAARNSKGDRNLDQELARLKTEYTRTVMTMTYELFQVAKQARSEEGSILTIAGIVASFDASKCTEKFVDKLLAQVMELVSLSRFDLLTPSHTLLVYQMFSILLLFLEQSKSVTLHVRNNYYEEFKYFIQAPAVSRKLPPHYPITPATITVIDQVVAFILGGQTARPSKTL